MLNSRFHDEVVAIAANSLLTTLPAPFEGRLTSQKEHWSDCARSTTGSWTTSRRVTLEALFG